jgi:hypothetical protein
VNLAYGISSLGASSGKAIQMKRKLTLSIPKPCSARWGEFKPTNAGGFCESCNKEVIDFTNWTEDQIKDFFSKATGNTCGKFHVHQLKTYQFHEQATKRNNAWLPLSFLGCALLLSSYKTNAQVTRENSVLISHADRIRSQADNKEHKQETFSVRGTIRSSEDSLSFSGVNIEVKNRIIALSDSNGEFIINGVKAGDTLRFLFVGYQIQEYRVTINTDNIEILLYPDITGETVIVGGCAPKSWSPRGIWWKIKKVCLDHGSSPLACEPKLSLAARLYLLREV